MKLVTAQEMGAIDKLTTDEYLVPGLLLMDSAAQAVAMLAREKLAAGGGSKVVVFAGGGNNGGDGFGAARWLSDLGASVRVFFTGKELAKVSGDAKQELDMLMKAGGRVESLLSEDDFLLAELAAQRADLILDAIMGTGFHGELKGTALRACELINASGARVLAVDVPTGVNADTGACAEAAVVADWTVTMTLVKTGLLLYPGAQKCGSIYVAAIGTPLKLLDAYPSQKYRLTDAIIASLLPVREPYAHKGDAGRVLILAGSIGFTGAAALCAHAAVKTGAGLVTLCTPLSSRDILAVKLTEVMVHGLLERMPGVLGSGSVSDIIKRAQGADVLAIGPGLGLSDSTQQSVREILAKVEAPAVIDADALTALAGHTDILTAMPLPKVLTPHPGEMARLTGLSVEEINLDRLGVARACAEKWQAVVVLKGAPTVVATPDGTVYVNSTGSSALATGGSGDVLTGMIAALIAQGITVQEAALCGVYLHGLAGVRASRGIGLAAGEIAAQIAAAREAVLAAARLPVCQGILQMI